MPNSTDLAESISITWLQQVQRADETAWVRLTNVYAPIIYGWFRRWGASQTDASDLVQDVLGRVCGAVGTFSKDQQGSTFRGWLWTISRNAAMDHFRVLGQTARAAGGTNQMLKLAQVPDHLAEDDPSTADQATRLLHSVLEIIKGDFQPRTWEIFWKSTILGQSSGDLAEEYDMTTRAIRQAKFRVMTRLREECKACFPEPANEDA